jgi:16S rRNA processing protein RimM
MTAEPPARGEDPASGDDQRLVVLGRIVGLFGVRGWVKVHSETSPPENILTYRTWLLRDRGQLAAHKLEQGNAHGKGVVARLAGCTDRDQAALLVGRTIEAPRSEFPPPGEDEYYWTDLEGLTVFTLEGVELGKVDHLFETGSNDVLVVQGERERLLPFTAAVIQEVDLTGRRIVVDWDPEF